ncbi:LysR family transcriptional regulator [Bordetella genomosp. 13]|uniref:LysR family transcriptional regulator n=1 Tax=Bordetella genomosp. 13 TaxID=463040 RepID=A0A1W6ZBC3_9BORD|nr:LysR family transcriptional regulator [Bordetella genomosp. 13]ARP94552.1 LysR family transcriptional regulator [Bordetella genomosp. 13]
MNLRSLETLRAILVHGSFTAAGEAVGCSPSAVSLQVKQLEQFFGQPLFDRSTRVIKPTPFALQIAAAADEFADTIASLRTRPSIAIEGRLRLGAITSMQSDLLPQALLTLQQRHPKLDVKIPPLNDTNEILKELRAGRIDVALVVRPGGGGSSRLAWGDLVRQPYVMLAPPGAAERSPQALVKAHGWVAYDTGLPGGQVAARHVRSIVPGAAFRMELRSMDALVSLVSLGMGVTVIPRPRRPLAAAYGVQEVDLGRHAPHRQIALAWRRTDEGNRRISAVMDAFVATCRSDA